MHYEALTYPRPCCQSELCPSIGPHLGSGLTESHHHPLSPIWKAIRCISKVLSLVSDVPSLVSGVPSLVSDVLSLVSDVPRPSSLPPAPISEGKWDKLLFTVRMTFRMTLRMTFKTWVLQGVFKRHNSLVS